MSVPLSASPSTISYIRPGLKVYLLVKGVHLRILKAQIPLYLLGGAETRPYVFGHNALCLYGWGRSPDLSGLRPTLEETRGLSPLSAVDDNIHSERLMT